MAAIKRVRAPLSAGSASRTEPLSPLKGREKAEKADGKTLKATLRKSSIGANPSVKATIVSLDFRKMNQTRELPDNPAVRGMLKAVDFLVAVEGEPYLRPDRSRYKIWRSRSNKKHQRGN